MAYPTELLTPEDLEKMEEWGRRVRREKADWDFIRRLPDKYRRALEYYIETGDIRSAATKYGINICFLNKLRIKANIPST
ncbi:MAG TPA: hypothetical protein ENF87_01665 [Thermoproteales archaeon]|nr:hypothetical protein [Thermoproteales archaeon]